MQKNKQCMKQMIDTTVHLRGYNWVQFAQML